MGYIEATLLSWIRSGHQERSGDRQICMNCCGLGWISNCGMSMQHMQHTHIACFDHDIYIYIFRYTDIEKNTSI